MKFRFSTFAVLIAVLLFVGYCRHHDDALASHFSEVSVGMTPNQVISIMGSPTWDGPCGSKLPKVTGPPNCNREIEYAVTMAPVESTYYLVWIGPNGRVAEAGWTTSP
jgi:hypothetical protein